MSRTLAGGLVTELAGGQTIMPRCLRLDLLDGSSIGITTLDLDITVNLGDGDLTYKADTGILPSAVKLAVGLDTDGFEARGPLTDLITKAAVLGGRFDRARARLFDVSYYNTSHLARLVSGFVGGRRIEGGQFVFEIRSLTELYNVVIGELVTPYCGHDFGDAGCGVNLDPEVWSTGLTVTARAAWDAKGGTVVKPSAFNGFWYEADDDGTTGALEPAWPTVAGNTVTDNDVTWRARNALVWPATVTAVASDMLFTVSFSAGSPAADYFNGGTVKFLTGDLAGTEPIEVFDYGSGAIQLLMPSAALPEVGDTVELTVPCLRIRDACRAHRNTWNFGGFPDVPGSDDYMRFKVPTGG